jgi:hypothetical protein
MNWEQHTLHTLKKLYNDEAYKDWSDFVKDGAIQDFSNNLDDLLGRLAGIVISELEIPTMEKYKIIKILELAAVAGKTL